MYAVVRTGGKQYRVAPGDILEVEKIEGGIGDTVTLDDVLLVTNGDNVAVGQPNVEGATVTAKITGQHRGEKILVFRYRPKKRIRVRRGHRQYLTRLEIQSIDAEGFGAAEAVVSVPAEEIPAEEETSDGAVVVMEEAVAAAPVEEETLDSDVGVEAEMVAAPSTDEAASDSEAGVEEGEE